MVSILEIKESDRKMEDVKKRELIKEFARKHMGWNKDQIIIGFPEKDKGEIMNLTKNFSVMVQVEQQDDGEWNVVVVDVKKATNHRNK